LVDAVEVVTAEASVFACFVAVEDRLSRVEETVFCAVSEVS
jgi:hypothetical protein